MITGAHQWIHTIVITLGYITKIKMVKLQDHPWINERISSLQ
jgi:hypothetical protein